MKATFKFNLLTYYMYITVCLDVYMYVYVCMPGVHRRNKRVWDYKQDYEWLQIIM